jgi:hypothetical protein
MPNRKIQFLAFLWKNGRVKLFDKNFPEEAVLSLKNKEQKFLNDLRT